ncbi:SAM-dependent methyltransferase [Streptomyces sp. NPDC002215]|uniref:SAM-dependent methyltransferase n=1 Tax=Streptomyces sp. NPDC002215 TaxID=3154412 RepID=UPI00333477E2
MTVTGLRPCPPLRVEHRPPAADSPLRAAPARMRNYVLGGEEHFPADRSAVRKLIEAASWYETSVRIGHDHGLRAAGLLAGKLGIRQFLDLGGSGLRLRPGYPDAYPRICSVLQDVIVVHIDTDATGTGPRGCTAQARHLDHLCVHADITQPLPLLRNLAIQGFIDLSRPVGVIADNALSWIRDDAGVLHLMNQLRAWAPPGSAIALTHDTDDFTPSSEAKAVSACLREAGLSHRPRTHAQITRLLAPWQLHGPGLVATGHYFTHHGADATPLDQHSAAYATIALHPEPVPR